jgi:hypothetical protein
LFSGCERQRLILILVAIVRIVFGHKTRWAPNVGSQSSKALTPNTGMEKVQRLKETREREQTEVQRIKNEGLKSTWIQ